MNSCFDIDIPRIIDKQTTCTLTIRDRDLLGSRRHFIRLDLYPIHSPTLLYRRHGYWDIPLTEIRDPIVPLQFREGEIRMKSGLKWAVIKPLWKGNIKFEGYAGLRVSLRERGWIRSHLKHVKSSTHLLRPDEGDLQLQQMYVPVTDKCNLRCPDCPKPGQDHLNESDIAPEIFHSLLEAGPHVFSVMLLAVGEPLLNKELAGMVRALRKRLPSAAKMGTTTNGMLMRGALGDSLMKEGIDWITFTLRGATAKTHETSGPGSDFHQILENIRWAVGRRKLLLRRRPILQADCAISEATVGEINDVVTLCKSLGLDAVLFTHPEDHRSGKILPLETETAASAVRMATETAERLRFQIAFPPMERLITPVCPFMQSHYLWTTGEVVPCCRMQPAAPSERIRVFGNLKKQALMDVWNSPDFRRFRSMVLAGDFPEVCQDCDYAAGLTG